MYGMSIKAYWANTVRSTVLLLLVVFEEISHFIHGVFKILKLRKINYPEMVRLFPVEAAAMNKKYLLLTEKIKHELLVICDVETLCVYLWEDIECRLRLYSRQTVNAVKVRCRYTLSDRRYVRPAGADRQFLCNHQEHI